MKKQFAASRLSLSIAFTVTTLLLACNNTDKMKKTVYEWPQNIAAPIAEKKPKELSAHGDIRIDPYYWLNDYFKKGPDSSAVVDYLKAENRYYDTLMAGTRRLQDDLFAEMKARIKEKDESVPYFRNGYYYYSRTEEGKEYYIFCRKKESLAAQEEILLDVNAMAENHSFFNLRGTSISPNNQLIAYGVDTIGRNEYTIYIKNIQTGELSKETISRTQGSSVWAADNKTFFYTAKNPQTLLSEKIKRHIVGTDPVNDVTVYHEKDPSNYLSVRKTKSDKYIIIDSRNTMSSEQRFISTDKPSASFIVFQPRTKEVLYNVDHSNNQFYIRTNLNAKNFKIMTTPENSTTVANWKELIAHNDSILIEGIEMFKNFLVVSERKGGLTQIHVIHTTTGKDHYIQFSEPTYDASVAYTPEFNTDTIRYNYTSLITPSSIFDYNMATRGQTLKKETEVVGGYNADNYVSERLYATAYDGTKVPISIIYKKGYKKDGVMPLLLYGYGSYGASMDASFSSLRLTLLDRGFAFAIAHIRGGQEMGRYWYEEGKMFKKKNTFTDFIDCAEYLIANQYTSKEHLYAMGGSAGGLLMGAVVNMRPDLWNGVVAQVPFVDVVTTMSDPGIPLTTNEYDEWGNPANKESYDYMKSYSPYDNVAKQAYPHMLVTTGLHDSQVQYFEPAKWIAKLRELKTNTNHLLLYTNMEAGHGGASGRFNYLRDIAREYAFIFALEGITK